MFCPGCGIQDSDDLKFCKQCGANLRGVRDAMTPRSTDEKFDWSKTWVADMFLTEEERERRRGVTAEERRLNEIKRAEEKRLNEIKGGVITTLAGLGAIIFLRFFLEIVARGESGNDAEIIRNVWLVGVVPCLVGVGLLINGLFVSRRMGTLSAGAAPSGGYSVTENTTAHLPEPAAPPPRSEIG